MRGCRCRCKIIIIIMVRRSREIIYSAMLYMDINAKYSIAHSHAFGYGPYIRRSNLANCKVTQALDLDDCTRVTVRLQASKQLFNIRV